MPHSASKLSTDCCEKKILYFLILMKNRTVKKRGVKGINSFKKIVKIK